MLNRWARFWANAWPEGDALAPYRHRIALSLCLPSAAFFGPLALWYLWNGQIQTASLAALVMAMLLVNVPSLRNQTEPLVPFSLMVAGLVVGVAGAISQKGMVAVLWAYPALFLCYFVLERRTAHWLSQFHIAVSTTAAALFISAAVALRVGLTMLLTFLMLNIVLRVISEQQRALRDQAITDPLTGAFNRREFDAALAGVPAGPWESERGHALLAIDIDHFKSINDQHGHAAGDAVLRELVQLIRSQARVTDQIFRTGGEEFILLLRDLKQADALRVADKLRLAVAHATFSHGRVVTVSMRAPGLSAEDWLRKGDNVLYQAKHGGRNRVVLA